MGDISVQIPQEQLDRLQAQLSGDQLDKAIYQAVYRTTRAGASIIRRIVKESMNLDAKYITRVISTAMRGSGAESQGHVIVSREAIPLVAFLDRAIKKGGISVTISKDRAPIVFRHAFYSTVGKGDGHKGIFFRAEGRDSSGTLAEKATFRSLRTHVYEGGRLTARGYARRLPIEQAYGPSVVDAIGPEELTDIGTRIVAELQARLEKNVTSQLKRFADAEPADAGDVPDDEGDL